jgi:serine/threonine-protein kinase SRPK3
MSCSSWRPEDDNESVYSARFQCVDFDSEDLERYEPGGFHPVHLGDYYDDMRYKIVHKLGAGGFSTVWLARDELEHKWVALKIVLADKSASVKAKSLCLHDTMQRGSGAILVVQHRYFIINGPNGLHLCLVLPVLGPSASQLSDGFDSRIRPWLSRRTGYQVTKALTDLHAQGLCHGGKFFND